ncbi:MAG: putative toxin-antitoxin system toxin component, PIN family [Chromatiales bacterium]|nr:putative toxin-antitoxin system toxin component, PIN family [Chromatiales bacterium]
MSDRPRLVFDTNCLISHLLLPKSVPAQAVGVAVRRGQLLASEDTLAELADVLARPRFDHYIALEDRMEFLRKFGRIVEVVPITTRVQACRDPRDDKFLELGLSGNTTAIISGDNDLLVLHPFGTVQTLAPADYLSQLADRP